MFRLLPLIIVWCCVFLSADSSALMAQPAAAAKPSGDVVYKQLRMQGTAPEDFNGKVATVTGVTLKRDAAQFKFISGEIYFLPPVEGRTVGAVFLGSGEMTLVPPIEAEKRNLAIFTGHPVMQETFSRLVMRFTDQTLQEIEKAPGVQMKTNGAQAARARDVYRENQNWLRKELNTNVDLRTLGDLYSPDRSGFFMAFPGGMRFNKLAYVVDPLGIPEVSPEQVALYSFDAEEGGIWVAFHMAGEYPKGTATTATDRRLFDITNHEIGATIRGTRLISSDRVTLRVLNAGTRVLPFDLYKSLRVGRVKNEQGEELNFVQEAKDDDADFGVILPEKIAAGQVLKLTIEYEGDEAIEDSGSGNFILIPRSTWYPNNGGTSVGDRAAFAMTFRFSKDYILVGTGALEGTEQLEGDSKLAKWTSGTTELKVAGFNFGKFMKKELVDKETGYTLEFYANKEIPDELKDFEMYLDQLNRDKIHITGITGKFSTTSMAETALNDAQNSSRIYTGYFGKLPYTRFALSQQPAFNFGQAWPTLIFMPYIAFIDTTQRTQLIGVKGGTDLFWRYVGPHETAHQWWGHTIGWTSYRDQWMSEGFSEFSASLYVQFVRKDMTKFIDFWDEQRKLITQATKYTKDKKPYTVGPITQGYRLNSGKTGNVARAMIYPKGAYVLHMLRMMMFDHRGGGDGPFRQMMGDFVKTHFNQSATTEDFKRAVEKHMTPQMDLDKNGRMDWFFNAWVYGTDIPAYRLAQQASTTADGKPALTLRITQSGVSDDFKMLVPIYVDFGKGWTRLGAAKMVGNTTVEIPNVPMAQSPKRVTICALSDVLYTNLEGGK